MKRYVAEPASDVVRSAMGEADNWFICRVGYVETIRAIGIAAGKRATRTAINEWPSFAVIEVDQALAEHAATLALDHDLRSLDAIHLAAALVLEREDLHLATWDHRLHRASNAEGIDVIPPVLT